MPTAYVFFATGKPRSIRPLKARRVRHWLMSLAIRVATRSRLTHCAIGDGVAVLDNTFGRDGKRPTCIRYWPFDRYILDFPGLVCYFEVPLDADPSLPEFDRLGPKHSWDVIWWWLSRGRTECGTSCVAIAKSALERGGVCTPREIVTPRQLHDWLERQGYHREALE